MRNLTFVFWAMVSLVVGASAQSHPIATLTASDATFGAWLGYSVAMSGSTVAAGAVEAMVNGSNQGAVYVFTKPSASPWTDMTESAKLIVPNGDAGDYLGRSVAISGDGSVIVAGATRFDGAVGAVYVFVKPETDWHGTITPAATLVPGPPPKSWVIPGVLGWSVAINSKADTIVAGAYGAGTATHMSGGKLVDGTPLQGAVYVWTMPSDGWASANGIAETAKLTASDGAAYDQLGFSVASLSNTIVAGAQGNKGAAYLFQRPRTGFWVNSSRFLSKLTHSNARTTSFGINVGIGDGELVAVGSSTGCQNQDRGETYVYVKPLGGWPSATTQTAALFPSDTSGGCFGIGIAVGNQSVIVGSPLSSNQAGEGYTFTKPHSGWTNLSRPAAIMGGNGSSLFGFAISVGGRTMGVGARNTPNGTYTGAGAVYLFSN